MKPKTIVVSTHLIDEISDVLEEIIIINDGKIVLCDPVDKVLQLGYTVSGAEANIEKYTKGKNVIREQLLGNLKMTTIYQHCDDKDKQVIKELGLKITTVKLQELIISLTNS